VPTYSRSRFVVIARHEDHPGFALAARLSTFCTTVFCAGDQWMPRLIAQKSTMSPTEEYSDIVVVQERQQRSACRRAVPR